MQIFLKSKVNRDVDFLSIFKIQVQKECNTTKILLYYYNPKLLIICKTLLMILI